MAKTRKYGHRMGTVQVETRHGFTMTLELGDWVDQYIYATGTYEDATVKVMRSLVGEGDVVADIGANIGFFTLLMAQYVGIHGKVWSFEPVPRTRKRLARNVQLNDYGNIEIREEAISNVDGVCAIHCGPEDHSGMASLRLLESSGSPHDVQTRMLGSCIGESRAPDFIKIDIEGAEYLALQGMEELLKEHHPDIVIEMSDGFLKEMGSSSTEVYSFLCGMGYQMFMMESEGLVQIPEWDTELPTQFNALFTVRQTIPRELMKEDQAILVES